MTSDMPRLKHKMESGGGRVRGRVIALLLMVVILLTGAYYRLVGQNWDDFTHLHPDERFLTQVAEAIGMPMLIFSADPKDLDTTLGTDIDPVTKDKQMEYCLSTYPTTNGVGDFFDSRCTSWYPVNIGHGLYVYGELPLFVVRLTGEFTKQIHRSLAQNTPDLEDDIVANSWAGYNGIHLVGRMVSAVADLFALVFLFLIGRRLYNKWVGLLAMALMAAAVLPIQLSHFWTADAFTILPVTVAFYFAVRAQDTGDWRDFIGFGVAMGASIASRINVLPLVGVIGLAALLHAMPVLDMVVPSRERMRMLLRMGVGLLLSGVFMFVTFRFAMPHAFQGGPGVLGIFNVRPYSPWISDVLEAQYLTSGRADIPPNHQWASRVPYGFSLWNMLSFGMGLPLGIMAWASWTSAGVIILRARPGWTRHMLPVVWILVYFALMGRLWVMAMRYYIVMYPFLALLAAWGLVALVNWARARLANAETAGLFSRFGYGLSLLLLSGVVIGTNAYAFGFTSIYRRQLSRVEASQWVIRNLPASVSMNFTLADGRERLVALPFWAEVTFEPEKMQVANYTVPADGTIQSLTFAHLLNATEGSNEGRLDFEFYHDPDQRLMGQGSLPLNDLTRQTSQHGDPQTLVLNQPIPVTEGQQIKVEVTLRGANSLAVKATGTVIATEGPWDDPVPQKACDLPLTVDLSHEIPPGAYNAATCRGVDPWSIMYKGIELYMAAEDDGQKRDIMQRVLDETDYITISSNRFYDTLTRIPTRFPMSIRFYEALFGGTMGFDLVKEVTSYPTLGPITIADQNLPFYDTPRWVNEFEAEESFHVYDHPAVLIFKKNASYSSANTARVLNGVEIADASLATPQYYDASNRLSSLNDTLINVIRWGAQPASAAPTGFMMPEDLRQIQADGGTFSQLFGRDWLVNSSQPLTVAIFWLTLIVFGLAIWPILYTILPGLPDRGYALAKISGLLVVSWIVWAGGTLRLFTWSSTGILLTLIGVAVVSGIVAIRAGASFRDYVRVNWRHFVVVELITFILFMAFLLVRLGNPDLWHTSFGGEKPMDFAYFNAVLRSSVFPPYDPWFAGGYLNYYYYGFVLVGAPIKLLGINPAVAYNLLVPAVFALTGISAFAIGFNVMAARWFYPRDEGAEERSAPLGERLKAALRLPAGSPYIAGIMALLLTTVLGNLFTPSIAAEGVLRLGGCDATYDITRWYQDNYLKENGRLPVAEEGIAFDIKAENPPLGDQIAFGVANMQRNVGCLTNGIGAMFSGANWPLGTNRWFWAARSIVGELPGNSNEINEFPMFTFTYGDLHAHMIALPVTLLVMGWLLSEVLVAGRGQRSWLAIIAGTALGGLAVGILRPTNTWDWLTYLVLGILGLLYTMLLRRFGINRRVVVGWGVQVLVLYLAQHIGALPFMSFFATSYSTVIGFAGNKTPIWAYLIMHGIFLFFILSFLIWQTVRVMRAVYVRDFVGRAWVALLLLGVIGIGALVTLFFGVMPGDVWLFSLPVPLAWLAVPLLVWCVILFFVPHQSREVQTLLAMIGLALGLTMAVELVVLFGDIGRQNTFFKFYMQIWFLLGIPAAVMLTWLVQASRQWVVRVPWLMFGAFLLAIGAMYPLVATQAKNIERMASLPPTLDGQAYMTEASHYEVRNVPDEPVDSIVFPLKDDLAIIRWLQDNVLGTPVILEARQASTEYKWNARIAINTGLPTVAGWNFHQMQQRTLDPLPTLVQQRGNNAYFMYDSPDIVRVWRMIKFYHVRYIIVGNLERIIYTRAGIGKFDQMVEQGLLKRVYENGEDRIYEVIEGVEPSESLVGMAPEPRPVSALTK